MVHLQVYYLLQEIRKNYLSNVTGGIVDGRLFCQFSVQIIPQIRLSNGEIPKLWSLNKEYYIIAATGSAQPDGKCSVKSSFAMAKKSV